MDSLGKILGVRAGKGFTLADHHPDFTGDFSKQQADILLADLKTTLGELQQRLYAANCRSVLLIFQAMDAAGKDSTIGHVMSGLNPQGCQVFSFKKPSDEEYSHDFLWRHYKALPEKGRIGIHNRSHYENVLVCRVHPELLLLERPAETVKPQKLWKQRYESIADFERHLARNGTLVLKFFLNVSKSKQKERFLERLDDPCKNWKFSQADLRERDRWTDYMDAYEAAIRATAAPHAPWFVIPADKKWFTRLAVASILVEELRQLDLKYPTLTGEMSARLEQQRKILEGD